MLNSWKTLSQSSYANQLYNFFVKTETRSMRGLSTRRTGFLRQFTSLHRASEDAGTREEIAQDGCGTATLVQTSRFPRLNALNGDASVIPAVPSTPCNGWQPCATFPRTLWHRSRAPSGVIVPTFPNTTRRLRPKRE